MAETLTALSQRNEAFWIGLALFLLGVITPETLLLGGIGLSRVLIFIGGGILLIRTLVGVFRILKTTAMAGAIGYREGQRSSK
jgi:CHASE2 domain-containing sensor protein